MATLAEEMAMQVLRGDLAAARALADHLVDAVRTGATEVSPFVLVDRTVPEDGARHARRLQATLIMPQAMLARVTTYDHDRAVLVHSVEAWLEGRKRLLCLPEGMNINVYRLG